MIRVQYVDPAVAPLPPADRCLGAIGFGTDRPDLPCPFARVELRPLTASGCLEIWTTNEAVRPAATGGAQLAVSRSTLFGVLPPPTDPRAGAAARLGYDSLFDVLDRFGDYHLQRVWNYVPAITAPEDGADRYQHFNAGRHDAFVAANRPTRRPPAASALGSAGGGPVIYFLAARDGGEPVENPRQVSAYDYPRDYGPRSPTFSRALRGRAGLFISGTASILGHRSQHPGDVAAQTAETLRNLQALMAADPGPPPDRRAAALKVYVRRPADLPVVRGLVGDAFPDAEPAYLLAEICRPELLVEIEAFLPA